MYEFSPGSASRSLSVNLLDSGTANGKTGLAYNSAGLVIAYTRMRQTAVAVTPVDLASAAAAYLSGGFKEVDGTLARGEYRFDPPDAALAVGVPWVVFNFKATGIFDRAVLVFLRNPVSNVGAGSSSYTVTVQRSDTTPIAGAQCWVSTDVDGANVIAGALTTNGLGQCTFLLDPGSYFLWCADEGFNNSNPSPITVT